MKDTPGLDPVTVDFELRRGVWMTGRVVDGGTKKPLARAAVTYHPLAGNPHVKDYPEVRSTHPSSRQARTADDGTFRVVGLPGPGALAVLARGAFVPAHQRDDEDGAEEEYVRAVPFGINAFRSHAVARVEPPPGAEAFRRDVALDPGETHAGTVVDPDGEPIRGARAFGLTGWWGDGSNGNGPPLATASFTVEAFNPRRPRPVLFLLPEKRWVGALEVPAGPKKPLTVRLRPGAVVSGRLVGADGQPRADVELKLTFRPKEVRAWASYFPGQIKTDKEGRWRLETLLPAAAYRLEDAEGAVAFDAPGSGASKDVGDVRVSD